VHLLAKNFELIKMHGKTTIKTDTVVVDVAGTECLNNIQMDNLR
jgi:hypothetical protein